MASRDLIFSFCFSDIWGKGMCNQPSRKGIHRTWHRGSGFDRYIYDSDHGILTQHLLGYNICICAFWIFRRRFRPRWARTCLLSSTFRKYRHSKLHRRNERNIFGKMVRIKLRVLELICCPYYWLDRMSIVRVHFQCTFLRLAQYWQICFNRRTQQTRHCQTLPLPLPFFFVFPSRVQ